MILDSGICQRTPAFNSAVPTSPRAAHWQAGNSTSRGVKRQASISGPDPGLLQCRVRLTRKPSAHG